MTPTRDAIVGLMLAAFLAAAADAAELKGTVQGVRGTTVTIRLEGAAMPRVGDKVELVGDVPGLGPVPLKGAWKVAKVEGGLVTAETADADAGKPQVGYAATVFTTAPVGGPQPAPQPEPVKPAPPDTKPLPVVPTEQPKPAPGPPEKSDEGLEPAGWMGVRIQNHATENLPVIAEALADGPAARAGLAAGDIVLEVNGIRLQDVRFFQKIVMALRPGTLAPVKVRRGEQVLTKTVTLGQMNAADHYTVVAMAYLNGDGVEKNAATAAHWLYKAALAGQAAAQNTLGTLYEAGNGTPKNDEYAFYWYKRGAEGGNAFAQFNVARRYSSGRGTPQNNDAARAWFEKAAAQGLTIALVYLGGMYVDGLGVPQDYARAMQYYRQAADQGDADGQAAIGTLYINGQGVPRDYAEALRWSQAAAARQNPNAHYNLGLMFLNGWGVTADRNAAIEHFRAAAAGGHRYAVDMLQKLGVGP